MLEGCPNTIVAWTNHSENKRWGGGGDGDSADPDPPRPYDPMTVFPTEIHITVFLSTMDDMNTPTPALPSAPGGEGGCQRGVGGGRASSPSSSLCVIDVPVRDPRPREGEGGGRDLAAVPLPGTLRRFKCLVEQLSKFHSPPDCIASQSVPRHFFVRGKKTTTARTHLMIWQIGWEH